MGIRTMRIVNSGKVFQNWKEIIKEICIYGWSILYGQELQIGFLTVLARFITIIEVPYCLVLRFICGLATVCIYP